MTDLSSLPVRDRAEAKCIQRDSEGNGPGFARIEAQ